MSEPQEEKSREGQRSNWDAAVAAICVPAGASILAAGAQISTDSLLGGAVMIVFGIALMGVAVWPLLGKGLPHFKSRVAGRTSRVMGIVKVSVAIGALVAVSAVAIMVVGDQDIENPPASQIAPAQFSEAIDTETSSRAAFCNPDEGDAVGTSTSSSSIAESVRMFRNGPERKGIMPGPGRIDTPLEKWRFQTRGEIFSSPTVVGDTIYFGSWDGEVYAVDASTHTERWSFPTGNRVRSTPAVVGRSLYVGSYDGWFYSIDPASGALRWKFDARGPVFSSPAVVDGVVYFGSGSIDDDKREGFVFAVEAISGRQLWCFQANEAILSSPAVVDGTVFVGSWDTQFYALDARTGSEKWPPYDTAGEIVSTPTVVDGVVYFGSYDGMVYALDAATGEEVGKFPFQTGGMIYSSPTVDGGMLYVASFDGYLYAINIDDADRYEKVWIGGDNRDMPAEIRSSPALIGDVLYIGSNDHHLYAVDLEGRKILWRFRTDGEVRSSPVLVAGVIYVGSSDGSLYALVNQYPASPVPS